MRGGERFFERREVREALLLLRGAARAGEPRGDLPSQVRGIVTTLGWRPEPPAAGGATRDRWESIAAIVQLAEDFTASGTAATLADFSAELERRAAAQHAPLADGVTLASLHAAKGLEWDAVFVVGLAEGLVPISYAETPEAVEEERRLLYVGVTRAREHVRLSWAAARSPGARAGRRPSRFLFGLRVQGAPQLGRPTGERAADRRASRRSCPAGVAAFPARATERKRSVLRVLSKPPMTRCCTSDGACGWIGKRAKLPAYCIHDATQIASGRDPPAASRGELASIGACEAGPLRLRCARMCSDGGLMRRVGR